MLKEFLALYTRTALRGSTRLTRILSHRLPSLQSLPVETEGGTVIIDLRIASAVAILAYPKSQSGESDVMRQFVNAGDCAFDIGAHFGFYTTLLSELVGKDGSVVAFEPNPQMLPSLKKTLDLKSNVRLFDCALSDQEGTIIDLYVPEDASMASLSDWTSGRGGNVHKATCQMNILDDLVESENLRIPQFIKCDVEGAELSVFRGAVTTLDRVDAPVILFELNAKAAEAFGTTTMAYFDLLESLRLPDYKFFEVTAKGLQKLMSRDIEYTNVLAVPASKIDSQLSAKIAK
ncbi:MAG: FkbM family methyltransferase [Pyrinomonadaceae bacterium]